MELVSIIMSIYKEPIEYLRQSIESILEQTYDNLEIIIILDNPDNKAADEIIKEYVKNDKRIIYIVNKNNIGLTKCLNKALSLANGSYIARMDADDISDKNRIEYEINYLKTHQLDLVGCQVRRIDSKGIIVEKCTNISYPSECIKKTMFYDNCIAHPTWLSKKEVYETLKGYRDIRACEDYDFLLRAIRKGFSLGICDSTLFNYRITSNSISSRNRFRQFATCMFLRKNIDNIEKIGTEEVEDYLKQIFNIKKAKRYEKGKMLLDKALENMRNKNVIFIYYLVISLFLSKYIWVNLYYILRIRAIRKKYR